MTPKQGLCMSDTTDREGGVHICSYLMRACWCVFLWRACTHVSEMHGTRAGSILAGNICFQLTGLEIGATERS